MLNNFIYTDKKSLFELELEAGNILDESIVFIKDTQLIWNHGVYFNCADSAPIPVVTDKKEGLMSSKDKDKLNYINIAFGKCGTYHNKAEKIVNLYSENSNWELKIGAIVIVEFLYTNTATNPTLNVNNTGAFPIHYNTSNITTFNLDIAGYEYRPAMYMYDGYQFVFLGWSYDANTTYSGMSETEASTGTSLTDRLISPKILNDKINLELNKYHEWSILDASLSTFSIDGVSYEFEDEMTWGEWCDSEYNTDGYYVDYRTFGGSSSIYIVSDEYITDGSGGAWTPTAIFKQDLDLDMDYALSEKPTNKIIADYDYRLFSPS